MKKIFYLFIIPVAAFTFQSCHSSSISAKVTADTSANGGLAIDSADIKFAVTAANGGLAEVALGKLALEKTTNIAVKNFADMMVDEHSKINDDLAQIATAKGIPLPATPDAVHLEKAGELRKMSEANFDKAYVAAMVDGHKKTLELMSNEAKNGKDADLKEFAAKTAKVVYRHLKAINNIYDGGMN
jgi:putative membrane protein